MVVLLGGNADVTEFREQHYNKEGIETIAYSRLDQVCECIEEGQRIDAIVICDDVGGLGFYNIPHERNAQIAIHAHLTAHYGQHQSDQPLPEFIAVSSGAYSRGLTKACEKVGMKNFIGDAETSFELLEYLKGKQARQQKAEPDKTAGGGTALRKAKKSGADSKREYRRTKPAGDVTMGMQHYR